MTETCRVKGINYITRLWKNLRIFSSAVRDNLIDDPTYFILQVARRFDADALGLFAEFCNRLIPRGAVAFHGFTLLLSRNSSHLEEYLRSLDPHALTDGELARLGGLAVAIQDPISAAHLLKSRDTNNVPLRRTQARYAWYLGRMQEAIDLLASAVPASNRQLLHYRSELDVFQGWLPIVDIAVSQIDDEGREPVALHFLTNSLPHTGSGYAQRSHSIMTSLRDEGWHVEVLTRAGYPLSVGKLLARAQDKVDGINYTRILSLESKFDLRSKIQQQTDALVEAVIQYRPLVLHTTTDFSNALAVMVVAEAFGLPWVYEVRGQLADTWASTRPIKAKTSQRYGLFKEREAFVATRATHVLTLGETMKTELVAQGVPAENIQIAPNSIGDLYLEEPIEQAQAREMLGLSKGHLYVGTVSSLVAYEGLDLLLHAASTLIPEYPGLRLLIVGSGVEANNLKELSRSLGIFDHCIFPGRVPRELARTYHCALDIFVVPRRNLSVTQAVTPLKPVEALASEVPVIAADLPALRELVTHGKTGLLVPPDDAQHLAAAIRTLLDDPSKRALMGAAGRNQMLAERTWAANAQMLSRTYRRISGKMQ